ncbi:MAG: hypothetical protein RMJ28_04695 [Nitrososphaerota archaeon]|nr:hypothetical protein [Candidatus Calditenuaceae archaeon]MDW8073518.1 hypothetical protein [Nitrososphaerota archaeon]
MRALTPLDQVVGHFCGEGYSVSVVDGVVWLSRAGLRGAVWVVPRDGGLDELLWAVMGATEYANSTGASYVALPSQLAKRIDESHFWTYGVGLIIYDEGGVREVLQPRQRADARAETTAQPEERAEEESQRRGIDGMTVEEMLRRIERLERELERLEGLELLAARLDALERIIDQRGVMAPRSRQAEFHAVAERARPAPRVGQGHDSDSLPSFLKDNPWVEVLAAKR